MPFGHINNASYLTWFEEARRPLFELFMPGLQPEKWNLILARVEADYLAQGYYHKKAVIKSWVEKIGNSSLVLVQEALQDGDVICRGKFVIVHFDYQTKKSIPIPEALRKELASF